MPDQNENSMVNEKVPSVYIIFLFLLISLTSTAQNNDTTFQGSIIAGTSQWFIISAANHPTVKAKILSIDGDFISVKDRGGSITKIEIKTIKSIEKVPYGKLGTFGLGFGLPYGTLGLNVEINVIPYLSITGGLGTTLVSGLGYSIGLKGYFRPPGKVWRPRASLYYGINGVYITDIPGEENESYTGISAGLGQLFLWKRHGFDLDLIYLITSKLWDEHSGGGKIKLSIGYRYAF